MNKQSPRGKLLQGWGEEGRQASKLKRGVGDTGRKREICVRVHARGRACVCVEERGKRERERENRRPREKKSNYLHEKQTNKT